jgi:hypothetical protein
MIISDPDLDLQKVSDPARSVFGSGSTTLAVEGTKGCRGDRGLQMGRRAVEGTKGRTGDYEPWRGQKAIQEAKGRKGDREP